jgi:SAM-dependent methyltransferase
MHGEARHFLDYIASVFSTFFSNKRAHDVGSGDINGNNKHYFKECEYTGNDLMLAPNVTHVCKTSELPFADTSIDTIISSECFEHDPEFEKSIQTIVRCLKPGGLFVFTCASTGRKEHGTRRSEAWASYGTRAQLPDFQDHYRNITFDDLNAAVKVSDVFSHWSAYYNAGAKDLYFWGIKKGGDTSISMPASYVANNTFSTSRSY